MTCILIGSWLRTSINKINTTSKHNRLHDMLQINKVINTPIIKQSHSYEVKQLLLQSTYTIPRNVNNVQLCKLVPDYLSETSDLDFLDQKTDRDSCLCHYCSTSNANSNKFVQHSFNCGFPFLYF